MLWSGCSHAACGRNGEMFELIKMPVECRNDTIFIGIFNVAYLELSCRTQHTDTIFIYNGLCYRQELLWSTAEICSSFELMKFYLKYRLGLRRFLTKIKQYFGDPTYTRPLAITWLTFPHCLAKRFTEMPFFRSTAFIRGGPSRSTRPILVIAVCKRKTAININFAIIPRVLEEPFEP